MAIEQPEKIWLYIFTFQSDDTLDGSSFSQVANDNSSYCRLYINIALPTGYPEYFINIAVKINEFILTRQHVYIIRLWHREEHLSFRAELAVGYGRPIYQCTSGQA